MPIYGCTFFAEIYGGDCMNESVGNLTIYFEEPFWVGVFERIEEGKLSVCKVTFGAEPKDCDVREFILNHYYELKFSPAINSESKHYAADNPKRRQRNVKRQLQKSGVGTKAQQALAAQREELKIEHKKVSKEQRETERQRRFNLNRQKRKEKHKGH